MQYSKFIDILKDSAEEEFADFQRRLIFTKYDILGVRTPKMRQIAKSLVPIREEVFSYPNEYYETIFIKLALAATLPYEQFITCLDEAISWIDNWALCDCFKGKCIKKHKEEFLSILEKLFITGKEFYQRYALVVLLSEYVEERYLPLIKQYIYRADTKPYYIYMATAWLTTEVLVKYYDFGVSILKEGKLDIRTHNKSIQKAIESYRLTTEQKDAIRALKIK